MMLTELTSIPLAALPLAAFKEQLRLGTGFGDEGLQDDVLEQCLRGAMSAIENRTGKVLIERQFVQSVTQWRDFDQHIIPMAPVTDINSVTRVDRAGTATVLDENSYNLRADTFVPALIASGSLPTIPDGGAVEIVFDAGYGADWTSVPDDLMRAVFILATSFYENRTGEGAFADAFPQAVEILISPHRRLRTSGGGR